MLERYVLLLQQPGSSDGAILRRPIRREDRYQFTPTRVTTALPLVVTPARSASKFT